MISILDYGMGNLRSVQKALERIGRSANIVDRPGPLAETELLVLPGVGAFDRAVNNLKQQRLWEPIRGHLEAGKPYLGICLGLQLLFESSHEGNATGLGLYRGDVARFEEVRFVPHMGWNDVQWVDGGSLRPDAVDDPCYYFVHSFYPVPEDESVVAGWSEYGGRFCAALRDGNRFGVQFHPEKSQHAGLDLLKRICARTLPEPPRNRT